MRKWQIMICMLMVLCLSACSGEGEKKETLESERNGFASSYLRYVIDAPDGNLYRRSSPINFWEAESGESVLLCGKPDCNHDTNECNAYTISNLNYYQGKLYGWDWLPGKGAVLYRADSDGSNFQEVFRYEGTGVVRDSLCSEGYIYYIVNTGQKSNGADFDVVYRQKLEEKSEPEELFKIDEVAEGEEFRTNSMRIHEGILYYDIREYEEGVMGLRLVSYDTHSGEMREICFMENARYFCMADGELLVSLSMGDELGVFRVDPESGTKEKVSNRVGNLTADDQYFYIEVPEEKLVYVCEFDGTEVDVFTCTSWVKGEYMNTLTSENYIYFERDNTCFEVYSKEDIGKEHVPRRIEFYTKNLDY